MYFPNKLFILALFFFSLKIATSAIEVTPAEKQTLQTAQQGAVILVNDLWSQQTEISRLPLAIKPVSGAQLLLSDKPEYFQTGDGIALQENVKPGRVRLYVYHVPQPKAGPKTISAVIENLGVKTMKFQFIHRSFPSPSTDYLLVGKQGLIGFFNSKPEKMIRQLAPGERMAVDPNLDAVTVTTDQLAHGFYEFEIDQPARITTFEREPSASSFNIIDSLPKLARDLPGFNADGAGRGLFLTNEFKVSVTNGGVYDTAQGAKSIILAGGKFEPYMLGVDSLVPGKLYRDGGNYGALYHVKIKFKSSDHRRLALLVTKPPGGGQWCGAQSGAVKVGSGELPLGVVAIPTGQPHYGNTGEMVMIQKFKPPGFWHKTGTIEFLYSPPGASCIPTPLILTPY